MQQAFIECGGAQCGICTPGMVMAAVDLLERNPNPTEADVRDGLAGNLCRCTGYMKIFESVVRACRRSVVVMIDITDELRALVAALDKQEIDYAFVRRDGHGSTRSTANDN